MKVYKELKDVEFPDCSKECSTVEYFGVCECEACCPHKFDKDDSPIEIKDAK